MIARVLAFVVLLVASVLAGAWLWLHQSLPKLDGDVSVRGLSAAVEIVRDKEGVPHLFATNERDAAFAIGYAHAQDRLWQLEFQRRVGAGRLAEVMGERAYDTDRLMRTLGFTQLAERSVAKLDAETRGVLDSYAAGVNAFLESEPVLPVEFQVFRIKPDKWKPADTVAWLYVMAWDLSGNWRTELARLRYTNKLGAARMAELIPPNPGETYRPFPDFKALYAEADPVAGELLARWPNPEHALGSNSWVVSGARSASGKPVLANDPHLGLQTPALWYLAHLATPAGNVVGGTLPGVPFIVLGRNDRVAWTMTTTYGDTQDLFIERLVPGDEMSYLTPTGKAKFEVREEVIRVDGADRKIRIRSTRHGPVISDVVKTAQSATPKGHVIALGWTALSDDPATVRAGLAINRARDRDQLVNALREFHAPMQNVVFADVDGRIGFIAPALVPKRRADNEAMGRIPVPGWDAKYDWQGMLAFEDLPAVHDPKSGSIVTANNKITPPGYKPFVSVDWAAPYRADRIEELLAKAPRHSLESFGRIQADVRSRLAVELLPAMQAASPGTLAGREAQRTIAGWKGEMTADSAAPLAFMAWYRELSRLVYADELGDLFPDGWEMRSQFMIGVMKDQGGLSSWCDNVSTKEKKTCAQLAGKAFDLAGEDLGKRYGLASEWRWGKAHYAWSMHRPFGFVPVASKIFSVTPETPGDTNTVNVGHINIRDNESPFANRHAASLRTLYDFADLEKSLYMHSTGQSGNVLSPWYSNLADRWVKVEYITIPTKREAIQAAHTLRLQPAK
ncbi:penicillin acylase family protein [Usitatibacter palustris]|uniref:Acyl-homoserine lactone acylase QuiP n=1 Tax=Usitatibacter palustris TaxID=2732487 RepID=A0A6M4H441_9PROT|nr:penicillin acylase family protein [Usitatibacter palustris]QJR14286.1 Acyl-homoserine lactone acylase QuiP [Usitatibacter palustris]